MDLIHSVRTSKLQSKCYALIDQLRDPYGKIFGPQYGSIDRTEFYCIAIVKDHRPKPSLNSELNIFVSSLTATVGRKIFPVPLSHLK